MCQSKAEGGKRCPFHLTQGVSRGMVACAAASTRLSREETVEVFEELKVEGADRPAPSREEVDGFIQQMEFQVRHGIQLTAAKRESFLRALRESLGRILPDGATFHAWKNLISESWGRVRRKASATFMISALAFSVGACGTVPSDADTSAKPSDVATAPAVPGQTSAPTAPETQEVPAGGTYVDDKPVYRPAATQQFGKEAAKDALRVATQITHEHAYNGEVLVAERADSYEQLDRLARFMTPNAAKDWRRNLKLCTFGTPKQQEGACAAVGALAYSGGFDSTYEGKRFAATQDDKPVFINHATTSRIVDVTSDGRIQVSIRSQADIRITHGSDQKLMEMNRLQTFYMSKTDTGWKVSGWFGRGESKNLRLASEG